MLQILMLLSLVMCNWLQRELLCFFKVPISTLHCFFYWIRWTWRGLKFGFLFELFIQFFIWSTWMLTIISEMILVQSCSFSPRIFILAILLFILRFILRHILNFSLLILYLSLVIVRILSLLLRFYILFWLHSVHWLGLFLKILILCILLFLFSFHSLLLCPLSFQSFLYFPLFLKLLIFMKFSDLSFLKVLFFLLFFHFLSHSSPSFLIC